MEVYDENKKLGFKRKSEGRRSSILKTVLTRDALTDIDPNQQNPRSPVKKKVKRISSRRVSFADTYLVKEFPRDSPHRPVADSSDSADVSPEINYDSGMEETTDTVTGSLEIKGLDQLLTGTIQSSQPSTEQDVRELPFPNNSSDSSLQSMSSLNPNHTINDTAVMDCESPVPAMDMLGEPIPDDFGESCGLQKIDGSAFLQSLTKRPSQTLIEKKLFVPDFPHAMSETELTTEMNTSLNKYAGYCGSHPTNVVMETTETQAVISVATKTSKQRLPLGSIPDSVSRPAAVSVVTETSSGNNAAGIEDDVKVDGKQFLSKLFGNSSETHNDDRTVVFHQNNDMEETEVVFPGMMSEDVRHVNTDDKTVVFGQLDNDMEHTEVLGRIDVDVGYGAYTADTDNKTVVFGNNDMEQTGVIGNIHLPNIEQLSKHTSKYESKFSSMMERTRHMSDEMEFTECHDGEISFKMNAQNTLAMNVGKKCLYSATSIIVDKEVPKSLDRDISVGNTERKLIINEQHVLSVNDKTRIFNDDLTSGIDMTTCVGEIEKSSENFYFPNSSEKTRIFSKEDITCGMEMTTCIGGLEKSVEVQFKNKSDETVCKSVSVDITKDTAEEIKIVSNEDKSFGMELTSCIGSLVKSTSETGSKNEDRTKLFSNENVTCGMEMTSCVGGLEKSVEFPVKTVEKMRIFSDKDMTSGMEMTSCVGGLEKSTVEEPSKSLIQKTRIFSDKDMTGGMEMTSCVGGLEKSTFEEPSKSLIQKTRIFTDKDMTGGMEMTSCVGGLEKSTVEEPSKSLIQKTRIFSDKDITGGMEMTSCVGGLEKSTLEEPSKSLIKKTRIFSDKDMTGGMEMTSCVGGLVKVQNDISLVKPTCLRESEKSVTEGYITSVDEKKTDSDSNVTCGMEFTSCVEGLEKELQTVNTAEKTKIFANEDISCGMEITSCVGGLDISKGRKSITFNNKTRIFSNDNDATAAMEITECVQDTVKKTEKLDEEKNNAKLETCKFGEKLGECTRVFSNDDKTSVMEMTACSGRIESTFGNTLCDGNVQLKNEQIESNAFVSSLNNLKSKLSTGTLGTLSVNKMNDDAKMAEKKEDLNISNSDSNDPRMSVNRMKKFEEKLEGQKNITERAHTEVIGGQYSVLKRKLYGLESMVKKRTKYGRKSEGGSIGSMKLQFDVDTAVTAPIMMAESEREVCSQKTQYDKNSIKHDDDNAVIDLLSSQPDIELYNDKDVADLGEGITDVDLPLDLIGSTNPDSRKSSESSTDTDQNRTINSTQSDNNQTLNSTRTREYSLLAEMAEKGPTFENKINHSVCENADNGQKDATYIMETYLNLFNWTSVVKKPIRRSCVHLPPVNLEDAKGVIEAWAIYQTQKDIYSEHYQTAEEIANRNNKEAEELEHSLKQDPPQVFKDVSNYSAEECDRLRDKVKALRKYIYKRGKNSWKEIKLAATTEYHTKLKERGDELQGEVEEMNNAAQKADEIEKTVQDCLQQMEEEIGILENTELPQEADMNHINKLNQDLCQKEIELQNQEKMYDDCVKERKMLQHSVLTLEEDERRQCLKQSMEMEMRQEEIDQIDKLKLKTEVIEEKLDPCFWEDDVLCPDNVPDMSVIKQLQKDYDDASSICEWELSERDSNHIDVLFLYDTLMLHIKKEPTVKNYHNKILSIKLETMLTDDAPKLLCMLHSLLHEIIDTDRLRDIYSTEAHLNKLLNEVSMVVSDIRMLYKEIDRLSLDYILKVNDTCLRWEVWSLKTLRKVIVEMTFKPNQKTYSVCPTVEVVYGGFRSSDVLDQMKQVPSGFNYVSRLLEAVKLDLLIDSISDDQPSS